MNDLTRLADEHLAQALRAEHGRSAHLFLRDGPLRQSVIALAGGARLEEHEAPPAASLQVLRGEVRMRCGEEDLALRAGQLARVPQERHDLTAVSDAVVLLTSVTATGEPVVVTDTRR
ncbi:cupin [Streptomyces sp. 3MP-14]|uniref:Cupin n=1 Tax=Streptomyces mimosae TaxID=2586635 RepID=A0A5N6AQL9_9ACTN|nr:MULTISPECIES: cupin [Streptomyces]KAB8170981.1 cupin [Streptomyces mimosae]KAB8179668.1 cupin [Streptomyces sp. 3MP-14]